jgi:SAM-dependent methyltransferase
LSLQISADPWYYSIIACPDCKQDLPIVSGSDVQCSACSFQRSAATPLNLTPIRPRSTPFSFRRFSLTDPEKYLAGVDLTEPRNTYGGPLPSRETSRLETSLRDISLLMSQITSANPSAKRVLDLGCGPRDKQPCFNFLGCQYVGLDVPGSAADIFGDAHVLPFRDNQFDVVFAYAVLEHLHNPFAALAEIRRVLNPNGIFVGTVAQGEPFHKSFFHHTPWALLSLSEATGFGITRLWGTWDTLEALAVMSGYPKMIRALLAAANLLNERVPILAPRRMMRASDQTQRLTRLHRAGAISFCMRAIEC